MPRLSWMLVAALSVPAIAAAEDSILLKPQFEVGRTRYIEHYMHLELNQSMGGGPAVKMAIDRISGVVQTIIESSAAGAKWRMTYDRIAHDLDIPGMGAMFDSDDPTDEDASPSLAAFVKPMLGMSLMLSVGADGNMTSCEGMKEVVKKVTAGGPNTFTTILMQELTDDRAKMTWGDSLMVLYPNKQVKVGDTWTKRVEVDLPPIGKVVTNYDCKLDKFTEKAGRGVAVVTYISASKSVDRPKSADKPDAANDEKSTSKPAMPSSRVEGQMKGTAVFDARTCELLTRNDEGTSTVEMTMGAAKVSVDQKLKQQITAMPEADRNKVKADNAKKAAADEADEKEEDSDK